MELPKWVLKFLGDSYVYPTPMWYTYKPAQHKVRGLQVREVLRQVTRGDILLHRMGGYLNALFTPGFWSHAGLFVGDDSVIHAIGEGVVKEDVLDFCRTDAVCILRVKGATSEQVQFAIDMAYKLEAERTGYDYTFQSGNKTVYCTEMVDTCYYNLFNKDYRETLGHMVLIPDHLYDSDKVEQILVIK